MLIRFTIISWIWILRFNGVEWHGWHTPWLAELHRSNGILVMRRESVWGLGYFFFSIFFFQNLPICPSPENDMSFISYGKNDVATTSGYFFMLHGTRQDWTWLNQIGLAWTRQTFNRACTFSISTSVTVTVQIQCMSNTVQVVMSYLSLN